MKAVLVIKGGACNLIFYHKDASFTKHLQKNPRYAGALALGMDECDIVTEILKPMLGSCLLMQNELKNPYQHVRCGSMTIVFSYYQMLTFIIINGDGDETVDFMKRKLAAFQAILKMSFGPLLELVYENRQVTWPKCSRLFDTWCKLVEEEQCFLVEALEKLHVNQTNENLSKECMDMLEKVMTKWNENVSVGQQSSTPVARSEHAALFVDCKLLALFSRRNKKLSTCDMLLAVLFAHSSFPREDELHQPLESLQSLQLDEVKSKASSRHISCSTASSTEKEETGLYLSACSDPEEEEDSDKRLRVDSRSSLDTKQDEYSSASTTPKRRGSSIDTAAASAAKLSSAAGSVRLRSSSRTSGGRVRVGRSDVIDTVGYISKLNAQTDSEGIGTLKSCDLATGHRLHSPDNTASEVQMTISFEASTSCAVSSSANLPVLQQTEALSNMPGFPNTSTDNTSQMQSRQSSPPCFALSTSPPTSASNLEACNGGASDHVTSSDSSGESATMVDVPSDLLTFACSLDEASSASLDRLLDTELSSTFVSDAGSELPANRLLKNNAISASVEGNLNSCISSIEKCHSSSEEDVENDSLSPSCTSGTAEHVTATLPSLNQTAPDRVAQGQIPTELQSSHVDTDEGSMSPSHKELPAVRLAADDLVAAVTAAAANISNYVESAENSPTHAAAKRSVIHQDDQVDSDAGHTEQYATIPEPQRHHVVERVFVRRDDYIMPKDMYIVSILPGIVLLVFTEDLRHSEIAESLQVAMTHLNILLEPHAGRLRADAKTRVSIINSAVQRIVDFLCKSRGPAASSLRRKGDTLGTRWRSAVAGSSGRRREELVQAVHENFALGCPLPDEIERVLADTLADLTDVFKLLYGGGGAGGITGGDGEGRGRSALLGRLRVSLATRLEDYSAFLAVRAQCNLTMAAFQASFQGLFHFVFVNRSSNYMAAPSMAPSGGLMCASSIAKLNASLKLKLWKNVAWLYRQLQRGYVTSLVRDGDFFFSYVLWFEDLAGTPRPIPSQPLLGRGLMPIGDFDGKFYRNLTRSLFNDDDIQCCEMFCVHLGLLPEPVVLDQCRRLYHYVCHYIPLDERRSDVI